jgi:hypothetical protein
MEPIMEPIDWAALQANGLPSRDEQRYLLARVSHLAGPAAPAPAPTPLPEGGVAAKWFFSCVETIWGYLRTKESNRWETAVAVLMHRSFVGEFPEVSADQLLWATNQWIQSTAGKEFIRFPAWRELMAPLYRCDEKGLAVRTWGFRPELPPGLQPTPAQLALMPARWHAHDPQAVIAAGPDGLPMLASTGPRQPLPLPGEEQRLLPPSNGDP